MIPGVMRRMRLTDEPWEVLEPYIPDPSRRADGRERAWRGKRAVSAGILWVLRSGARGQDLPPEYPPYQTGHRRFQQWVQAGVFAQLAHLLAADLLALGDLNLDAWFIDGTLV